MSLPPPPRYPPPPSRPPPDPNAYAVAYGRWYLLGHCVFAAAGACLGLSFVSESGNEWWSDLIIGSGVAFLFWYAAWACYVLLSGVPWLAVDAAGIHIGPNFPRGGRSRPWAQVHAITTWTRLRMDNHGTRYVVTYLEITCLPSAGSTPRLTTRSASVTLDVAQLHRAVVHFAPHIPVRT